MKLPLLVLLLVAGSAEAQVRRLPMTVIPPGTLTPVSPRIMAEPPATLLVGPSGAPIPRPGGIRSVLAAHPPLRRPTAIAGLTSLGPVRATLLPTNTTLRIGGPGDDPPAKKQETDAPWNWMLAGGVIVSGKSDGALVTATRHKTLKLATNRNVVRRLVWQLSALPFNGVGSTGPGRTWRNPPGRIASGEVAESATDPGVFKVPLNALTLMLAKGIRDDAFATQVTTSAPPLDVFIRVVPLTASGDLAGAPSNAVPVEATGFSLPPLPPKPPLPPSLHFRFVSYAPPVNYGLHEVYPPGVVAAPNPEHIIAINGNLQVKDLFGALPDSVNVFFDEPGGHQLKNNNLGIVEDGQALRIDWSPADDATGWDKFRDKLVSDPVGTIARAYNAVKAQAVSAVAVGLGPQIAGVVVDSALLAAGIPPDLPDLGKLESQGLDFVIDTSLEQIGGSGLAEAADYPLPGAGSVTGQVKQKLTQGIQAGVQAVTERSQAGKFFIVNPAYQFRPPVAIVEVSNPDSKASLAQDQRFSIRVTDYLGDGSVLGGPSRQTWVLWSKKIHVPPMAPGAAMRIPVVYEVTTWHPGANDRPLTESQWVTADFNADASGNQVEFLGASTAVAHPALHKAW